MSEKTFIINRPNWLASEVGRVVKTITVPSTTAYVVENNRKIVKSGTIFTTPYYGLLYNDADITDGNAEGSLMVGGYYIDAKLPATAASYKTNFAAQGLFPLEEGDVTRPDFGTVFSAPALTIGSLSAAGSGKITWTKVENAVGYAIYESSTQNGSYTLVSEIAQTESPSHTGTATKYYKVKALGDNIYYSNSALSTATQATA